VKRIIHPAIQTFKKRLIDEYGDRLVRFIVFGSHVRELPSADSDIDIFLTLSGNVDWKTEFEIWDIAYDIDLEYDVILDVKVYSEEDISHTIRGRTPFVVNVLEEGIPV